MERRLITPAEAALLLEPRGATAAKCIQAGLLSLVDAGRIAIEPPSTPLKTATLVVRPIDPAERDTLPAHIEALGRGLSASSRGTRLTAGEVVQALQRAFGAGFRRFVHDEVAPSLVKRGLITRIDDKWLGLFPRIKYRRTAQGEAMAAPFERLMLQIEQLPALIERDPEAAIRLARSAGVLLIMSPKARRQIPALRKLFANRQDDGGSVVYVAIDGGSDDEHVGHWLDIGDMALEFDIPALFDSVDAVVDVTSSSDSGGSSDGGGDGGGGGGD